MLERRVSHPLKVPHNIHHQGIAAVILDIQQRVLLIEETVSDPLWDRTAGQLNILTGTIDLSTKERVKRVLLREVHEELGIAPSRFSRIFKVTPGTYGETMYTSSQGEQFTLRCIVLTFQGNSNIDPNLIFESGNPEIGKKYWVPYSEVDNYPLEDGARGLLSDYQVLRPDLFLSCRQGLVYSESNDANRGDQ